MPGRSSAALLALALSACGGPGAAPATSGRAVLQIDCPVGDAVLWIDGRYLAQVRDLRGGVALSPGHHQVELRHDRYHAHYADIELRPGQRLRLAIPLAEALP
jgi:hypothetical protein